MTMVVGYRHTGIIVENMEQSLVFYQDFLGLEVIQEFWDDSDYICRITCLEDATAHFVKLRANDGTVLELLEYPTHRTQLQPQPIHNVGVLHIAFEVGDVDLAVSTLQDLGVRVLSNPEVSPEGIAKVCFCLDPNGIRIELVEMLVT